MENDLTEKLLSGESKQEKKAVQESKITKSSTIRIEPDEAELYDVMPIDTSDIPSTQPDQKSKVQEAEEEQQYSRPDGIPSWTQMFLFILLTAGGTYGTQYGSKQLTTNETTQGNMNLGGFIASLLLSALIAKAAGPSINKCVHKTGEGVYRFGEAIYRFPGNLYKKTKSLCKDAKLTEESDVEVPDDPTIDNPPPSSLAQSLSKGLGLSPSSNKDYKSMDASSSFPMKEKTKDPTPENIYQPF